MFIVEKYKDEYSNNIKNQLVISDVEKIVQTEKEYEVSVSEWNIMHFEKFLKNQRSVSPNTLHRTLKNLRQYVAFICKKENIKPVPKFELEYNRIYSLIDYDKMMSVTLNPEQYNYIKDRFNINARDKVILELAWLARTVDEIKNIKESDVTFKIEENGLEIAHIRISDNQTIDIKDAEIIQDIKKCMSKFAEFEPNYYIDSKDQVSKHMDFRDSQYLIKPVKAGRIGKDSRLNNPSLTLQNALKQQEITCPGINASTLNIENVRRSSIIFMLAPQNEPYYTRELITAMLDSGNIESNLVWLQKVARMKYKD